ncbi:carbohydrate ABC transporter permease [Weissella diestrammenae]|uniref:Carbohydrate ABC transporter permease n=1 Tax=Weissella diestrammenae TaxID=1162633 RepID=A0A7G9T568_9LACO|nr:carbohydrate ABC transporter permease [Weissella diestrammenae]MCM0583099.1 carbohydrate ABC transporter permease [Weissella diestrammenae]QNN75243.1 carbohydrate ABC transporter permease [Weissella diestrammenae]
MKKNKLKRFLQITLISIGTGIVLMPLILGGLLSFTPSQLIMQGHLLSTHFTLVNYRQVFIETPMLQFLWHSLVISTLVMLGQMLCAISAAYAFVFLKFRFKRLIFGICLSTMMLPFEAQIIPNFNTMRDLDLLNSYAAMGLPFMASAFGIFMIKTGFERLPNELYQLSQLEGLTHLQFINKVVLPYSKVTLVTFGLYSFLSNWNMYLWPLVATTNDKVRTVQIGLRQLRAQDTASNWGLIMAATMVAVSPTLIIIFCGQRYFKSGLTSGVVK